VIKQRPFSWRDLLKLIHYVRSQFYCLAYPETIKQKFSLVNRIADQKIPFLQQATAKLDLAKFFLHTLWEIKALDNKKYILLSEKLNEIGKMLGGWMRGLEKRNPAFGGE